MARSKNDDNEAAVERMTLEGALISLATLEEEWKELEWLEGLVLCGPDLDESDVHEELSFVAVHSKLTKKGLRKAKRDLSRLIKQATPVPRAVSFTDDLRLLERIREEDPSIQAFLGKAILVWSR